MGEAGGSNSGILLQFRLIDDNHESITGRRATIPRLLLRTFYQERMSQFTKNGGIYQTESFR